MLQENNNIKKLGYLFAVLISFFVPVATAQPSTVKIALTVDVEYDRGIIYDNPTIYGQKFNTKLDSSWVTSRDLNDEVSYYYEFDTGPMKHSEYWERLVNFGNGNSYVLSKNSYKYITNQSDTQETRRMFAPVTLFGMPENVLIHPLYDQNDRNMVYNAISWNYLGETTSHVDVAVFDCCLFQNDFSWLDDYTSSDGPTVSFTYSDIETQLTSSYLSGFDAVIISGYDDISLTSTRKQAIYDALADGGRPK